MTLLRLYKRVNKAHDKGDLPAGVILAPVRPVTTGLAPVGSMAGFSPREGLETPGGHLRHAEPV